MRIDPIRPVSLRGEVDPDKAGLVLQGVRHSYGGEPVVDGVSLTVGPGELLCLLGPSGCGKTTTLRICAGLEAPTEGEVRVAGMLVADRQSFVPPERRNVGFLFQDYALFPHLSVEENVVFGLEGMPRKKKQERAREVLSQVGMADYIQAYPHTLSGGQQQRVGLARALAPEPKLMLLDEPFSGLDRRLRDQVRDETLHVLKASGVATVMVTHDPEEAMFMADAIALMNRGRIVQMGSPVELYCYPKTAFAARFFGEVNEFAARVGAGGQVETPLGPLDGRGLISGAAATVMVRPEALKLAAIEDGASPDVVGRVLASRMLGRTSLVHLQVETPDGAGLHLHARVPGRYLPPPEERLEVSLDRSLAFVYPAGQD
ncbi:ABC transporter ATP-binding protein [Caenispirillum bisanense]|uniref:Iron(III) transport system ATP-binding protein n=1 Tax=Caenispirillum bisanense TaxID=414052 RepID=A0A286H046_9PROT|nr:ABC transporter ATP-binding protein [Caenispirillum bisanense]SOE01121.1 iron(III) transport system ATP-binding protein [Caenispirillum bisanense]